VTAENHEVQVEMPILGCFTLSKFEFFSLLFFATYINLHVNNQGSGGVPIPGGVQKTCRCGTSGHGFAGMVVMG